MAKTLLVSLQGIGNAILALPLAKSLHEQGDQVELLTLSGRLQTILPHFPPVAEAIVAGEKRFQGWAGKAKLIGELRRRRFDRAVFSFPSGKNSYRLAKLAGIKQRIGHADPSFGRIRKLLTTSIDPIRQAHDLEQNMEIAKALGEKESLAKLWPFLFPPDHLIDQVKDYLSNAGLDPEARYLGLHPGCDSHWVEKRWPVHHFAKIAEEVFDRYGMPALVFDGPAEAGAGLAMARTARSPVHALNGWGSLADAWGLMGLCDLFVSNDSGLMNLATAAGVPTVAVFGPSQPHRTRPFGPHGRAVITDRTCAPCYNLGPYPGCPYEYHHCMSNISPAQVMAAISELMET